MHVPAARCCVPSLQSAGSHAFETRLHSPTSLVYATWLPERLAGSLNLIAGDAYLVHECSRRTALVGLPHRPMLHAPLYQRPRLKCFARLAVGITGMFSCLYHHDELPQDRAPEEAPLSRLNLVPQLSAWWRPLLTSVQAFTTFEPTII